MLALMPLVLATSVSAAAAAAVVAAVARPHIIMMLADDWGSYDASCRMKELGRTPVLWK
jgi:NaMN:DMB phosphoribosyltransferase